MDSHLTVLRASAERLAAAVRPLDDDGVTRSAYPSEWSIADVLSHLGSGAVIMQRRLDDGLAARETPDDFAPSVWDEWNAKSPRQQVDDALVADAEYVARLESLTPDERATFRTTMGPMDLDLVAFVGMRLNEHALHTWDVEVALDPAATVPPSSAEAVVDNLQMIARFAAKPTGSVRTITVRTTDPVRGFVVELTADAVAVQATDEPPTDADLVIPAEAFVRLVYGRLDPDHTPDAVEGDGADPAELRKVFAGV